MHGTPGGRARMLAQRALVAAALAPCGLALGAGAAGGRDVSAPSIAVPVRAVGPRGATGFAQAHLGIGGEIDERNGHIVGTQGCAGVGVKSICIPLRNWGASPSTPTFPTHPAPLFENLPPPPFYRAPARTQAYLGPICAAITILA